jgi:hypothetical protein
MHAEPVPDIPTFQFAEMVGQRLAAVDIEVIHDEVDGIGGGDAKESPAGSAPLVTLHVTGAVPVADRVCV